MRILLFVLMAACVACTDTTTAGWAAIGSAGHITCFSGTQVIYEGHSTGVIHTVSDSDGWEFKDAATGKFVRVSGACVIRY